MKSFIIFCISISIVIKSFSQDSIKYPLRAEAKILNTGYYPYVGMEIYGFSMFTYAFEFGKLFNVELKITNTSNRILYICAMTCSWEATLILNNKYVRAIRPYCDYNFPNIFEIRPNESKDFNTILTLKRPPSYTYIRLMGSKEIASTRLGFIIVGDIFKRDYYIWNALDKSRSNLYEYANIPKNQKAIIWSNILVIN